MATAPDPRASNREVRRIRVLPDRLANMIAAGEVVERPSAVVKELVENALDAGATNISVELGSGGRALVQVSDDGSGMNADDAVLAFERHATSKIAVADDLDAIATYGFRGEALPSIAAVSKTTLETCPDESGVGTEVVMEGGQLRAVRAVGRARGTTISVRNLFFNTPARRKFLRGDNTELRHATRELIGLALGRPALGFRLGHGGRTLFACHPAATWQERVQTLFGREMLLRGVAIDTNDPPYRLVGLLGRPGDAGGGFSEQYLLVNGRSVQSRILRKAIQDGYEATIESGKLPFFILMLDVDPAAVDVNVHPQKREVRFADERAVYGFVRDAVRRAFAGSAPRLRDAIPAALPIVPPPGSDAPPPENDAPSPGYGASPPENDAPPPDEDDAPRPYRPRVFPPIRTERSAAPETSVPHFWRDGEKRIAERIAESGREYRADDPPRKKTEDDHSQLTLGLVSPEGAAAAAAAGEPDIDGPDSHLWQFQEKYIFVSTREGLWIIDQHVAHERVLFEEAMAAFAGERPTAQRILFPLELDLTPEEDALFDDVQPLLEGMGFDVRRAEGGSKVAIEAYPASVESWADGQIIREMIDDMAQVGFRAAGAKERIATSYACHAAVKSGDPLAPRKMRWLIERLFGTSMPYVCPHGRPVIVKIATEELDHRFGRS